ncbi:hypothetical protein ACWGB8_11025 [Kitasatospora sp. NPDC054939]
MTLSSLTLHEWRTADPSTARRIARQAAERVGGRVVAVEEVEHLGARMHAARIERDSEVTSDPAAVHGGDGGESVCGGYGALLGWLPLATANRNPFVAEFLRGPDGEDLYEDMSTRPVLDL